MLTAILLFGQYSGHRLSFHGVSWSHSDTAHAVELLRTRDQTLRLLPDNTLHSQGTDVPSVDGIRNPNPSNTKDADPCLRPPGHRNRLLNYMLILFGYSYYMLVTGAT